VLFGYGIAGVIGLALAGLLSDCFPRPTLLAVAGVIAVALVALGLAGTTAVAMVGATVLWGIGFGAQPTLLQTAARHAAPDAGDAAPGLSNATTNVGIAGGGLLGGLLVAEPTAIALTGAALAALALLLVLLSPTGRPTPVAT
jgi:DHA1 family inner membrane transport protein